MKNGIRLWEAFLDIDNGPTKSDGRFVGGVEGSVGVLIFPSLIHCLTCEAVLHLLPYFLQT